MVKTELKRYSFEDLCKIAKSILAERRIEKSLYIYSKEILQDRLEHLKRVFPSGTNHAVAIKSNSHPLVLREIVKSGCGLEAASFEEVELAVAAECPYDKIVFDSPVKTHTEIEDCNRKFPGMIINANCFEELERLKGRWKVNVGIRVNPLVDIGSPGIYNVSSKNSKFGIPINAKAEIIRYALEMENVRGLHIHAGSEIGSRENHIMAISSIVEIAEELRSQGKKLDFIDIGGGIPANVDGLEEFYSDLVLSCPLIEDYKIVTEYGRFVQTHCAFVLTKVEYVLDHCNPNIALIHVGADLFPREIYSAVPPHHDFLILDPNGEKKNGPQTNYDIGGPLCFSGDFLARGIALPDLKVGDYVAISDAGANSLSMWSKHCSRKEVELYIYG